MPRGGAGRGQGRKRKHDPMTRLRIGQRCEVLWRAHLAKAESDALDAATHLVRDQWAKAQSVPLESRSEWVLRESYQDYLEDVRGAMQEDQGIDLVDDDSDPMRFRTIEIKRPWGTHKWIIGRVAKQFGTNDRMVRECWQAYRKLERKLRHSV